MFLKQIKLTKNSKIECHNFIIFGYGHTSCI